MAVIDVFASAPWYVDHLAATWLALPAQVRGRFHVSRAAAETAKGLPGVTPDILARDPSRAIFVVSYGDYRTARMAGRVKIALGQHGAGQSYSTDHRAYPGGRDQEAVSLFLCPNEHSAMRSRKAYPKARVEIIGCPKLDTLPRKARADSPVIATSFHWDGAPVAPEMRSAWAWYRQALFPIAKRWKVIGHSHPRSLARLGRWYSVGGIEIVPSFAEVLARADLYVFDNSSSGFEFAATGRPVVVMNAPPFRRDVEHGLRFWEASGVGVNVDDPRHLGDAIELALADAPELRTAREAALDVVYSPRSGGAAVAAAALVDWA